MSKLKFKLEQFDNVLIFQILEQDESITRKENMDELKYKASNGITISSLHYPNWGDNTMLDNSSSPHVIFEDKTLYIKGNMKDAPNTVVITLTDKVEAELLKFSILEALYEWYRNGYFEGYFDLIRKDKNGVYSV